MKFRTLALAGAAMFALTVSASAADTSWYVGFGAGWNNTIPVSYNGGRVDFRDTWRGIATLGYAWDNHVRLEGEFGYTDPDAKLFVGPNGNGSASGDLQEITLMGNLLYDAPLSERWYLTFGGGLGWGFLTANSEDKSALAWQLIAGVTYRVSPDVDLQFDYRYVSIEKVDIADNQRASYAFGPVASNNLMLSLRWYFDQPPPPPPPPPPPVTTFIVFFDFEKSNLTDAAQAVVAEAVRTAKTSGFVRVHVVGHTDTVGSDGYNQALSERRGEAVKDEMVRQGMDGSTIAIEGKSFHDPLVPTGPGVREPQNRRAVIDLGK